MARGGINLTLPSIDAPASVSTQAKYLALKGVTDIRVSRIGRARAAWA
jgi:hypothetical protein